LSARHAVVIGGGAVGVCAAWYLARDGWRVTLLERAEVGEGCSFGNAGLVVPSHSIPLAAPGAWQLGLRWMLRRNAPFRLRPRADVDLARWLWAFVRSCTEAHVARSLPLLSAMSYASLRLWRELAALPGFDFGYREEGMLMVYRTAAAFEAAGREARRLRSYGVGARVLDAAATLESEPSLRGDRIAGSVCFPDDAQLVPDLFVKGLAERARAEGVEIVTSADVLGFERRNGGILAARTSVGDFPADEFVLAAGAASDRLARRLGLRLGIESGKGYSVTFDRISWRPRRPLMLGEDRLAITPMGERLRLSGTLELAADDLAVDRRRALALLNVAGRWLEGLPPAAEGTEIWTGLRPCTPDGLPVVGRSRGLRNLAVATGHAMLGVSLAPITGRLIRQLLGGEKTDFPLEPLSPDRFGTGWYTARRTA
jgi:D-amino-acid dehydrogenase